MNFKIFKKSKRISTTMNSDCNEYNTDSLEGILRFQGSCRLTLIERLEFLYPELNQNIARLPPCDLSPNDKSNWIKVSTKNHFQCEYHPTFGNNGYHDVGSIRTSNSIPQECGIYYYEVLVLNEGKMKYIAVGLTAKGTDLNHQPGWDQNTIGYHGDNGLVYRASGSGKPYGPTFGTNDVIGCGLNMKTRSCFFTKNGKFLGNAAKWDEPVMNLYPTIGLHSKNESVEVNLGQKPFVYNIKMEMLLNDALQKDISL